MKFATETILEAEADVRSALRDIQAASSPAFGEAKKALIERAVGRLAHTAADLRECLGEEEVHP